MLFHNGGLKNNEVKFFPNGDTFHCSQLLPICRCCRRPEDDTDLPEAIVESAKNLIISKNKDLDVDQVHDQQGNTDPSIYNFFVPTKSVARRKICTFKQLSD
jgi:hypothetical protein